MKLCGQMFIMLKEKERKPIEETNVELPICNTVEELNSLAANENLVSNFWVIMFLVLYASNRCYY